jgi:predicted nucleic acid-binding protein
MPRVYIDTNVILDFYRGAPDPLAVFRDLALHPELFVFPEQTLAEVRRNRETMVRQLLKTLEPHQRRVGKTALLQGLTEFEALERAQQAVIVATKPLEARLKRMLVDPAADSVWVAVEGLLGLEGVVVIPTTDELVVRAQRRKAIGEPPTSPDKYTVGDELIWEGLLAGCRDDLIVVSRDGTYSDHESTLAREYQTRTGHKLLGVMKTVGEALKRAGVRSPKVEEQERAIPPAGPLCEKCGGEVEENGYDGSDGDSAWWLECVRCGHIQEFH